MSRGKQKKIKKNLSNKKGNEKKSIKIVTRRLTVYPTK